MGISHARRPREIFFFHTIFRAATYCRNPSFVVRQGNKHEATAFHAKLPEG